MLRRGKRLPTYLEPDELDALLAAAKTPLQRLYFLLCSRAGLRAFEACKVRWDDITWRGGRAFLRVLGKGQKEAELPLHQSIQDALQQLGTSANSAIGYNKNVIFLFPGREPGTHIVTRASQHWMTKTCRRAGIEGKKAHLHSLRHSFATHLLRGGVNIRDVQDLMRHSNLSTTSRYLHTTPERLTAAVDVLP